MLPYFREDLNISSSFSKEEEWYKQLNWAGKRSMYEITIVPGLKEIMNRMNISATCGDSNIGSEERL